MADVTVLKASALENAVGAALDAADAASAVHLDIPLVAGTITIGTNVFPWGVRVGYPCTIDTLILRCNPAPTGSALTVTVVRGGTTLGTVSCNAGATSGMVTGQSIVLSAGDLLTFDATSVGSTTPAGYPTITLIGG